MGPLLSEPPSPCEWRGQAARCTWLWHRPRRRGTQRMSSRVRDASVWVNAPVAAAPALQAAVVRAGGAVSDDPGSANAIVWAMDDPPSIERYLAPSTEWVQLSSAGIEDWFQAGVIDERRLWTAAKGVYAKPIAEYVVAMLLTAARRLHQVVGDLEWRPRDVETLAGKTVGIIGAGGIGQAVVELLTPFGVQTIAMTRSGRNVSNAGTSVGPKALEQLLAQSDFVVLAAPETPQTIGMLSARQLALLQPHAWLVNVGRGT